jgi:hypothetical protein
MHMTNSASNSTVEAIFAHLSPEDVEQFYFAYKQWAIQQRIAGLRREVEQIHRQLAENEAAIQAARPTPIALASLARLQANGVSDVNLLDRMLERGEEWLDRTMQRLEYFEQLDDFLKEDYTQWCTNALEGAYDWVDPLLFSTDAPVLSNDVAISVKEQEPEEVGATEEQLLQKLAEEPEDEADDAWQTATLKREAISLQPLQPDEREQELIVELSETGIETNEVAPVYNEFVPTAEEAFSEPETQSVAEEYIAPEETSQYEVNEVKEQPELHEFPANEAAVPITETEPSELHEFAVPDAAPLEEQSQEIALHEFAVSDQPSEETSSGESKTQEMLETSLPVASTKTHEQQAETQPEETPYSSEEQAAPWKMETLPQTPVPQTRKKKPGFFARLFGKAWQE